MSDKKTRAVVKKTLDHSEQNQLSGAQSSDKPLKPTPQLNNIAVILDALENRHGVEALTINEEMVEILGRSGVTVKNACSLLHKSFQYFDDNPTMKQAFERGRANLGSRVRSKLIEAALENNNIQSAIHLDKIYSADAVATEVNLNVTSQLSTVSDEDLLAVAFKVDTVEDGLDSENSDD